MTDHLIRRLPVEQGRPPVCIPRANKFPAPSPAEPRTGTSLTRHRAKSVQSLRHQAFAQLAATLAPVILVLPHLKPQMTLRPLATCRWRRESAWRIPNPRAEHLPLAAPQTPQVAA